MPGTLLGNVIISCNAQNNAASITVSILQKDIEVLGNKKNVPQITSSVSHRARIQVHLFIFEGLTLLFYRT